MVTDRTFAEITSTLNRARTEPIVAVIVAEPGLTPVNVPSCDTRATDGAELVHITRSSARRSPVAERTIVPRRSAWPERSFAGRGSIAMVLRSFVELFRRTPCRLSKSHYKRMTKVARDSALAT